MRSFASLAAITSVVLGLSVQTHAQPVADHPTFFVFNRDIPCGFAVDPTKDYMKHMIYIDTNAGMSGAQAAEAAFNYLSLHYNADFWLDCNNNLRRVPWYAALGVPRGGRDDCRNLRQNASSTWHEQQT